MCGASPPFKAERDFGAAGWGRGDLILGSARTRPPTDANPVWLRRYPIARNTDLPTMKIVFENAVSSLQFGCRDALECQ